MALKTHYKGTITGDILELKQDLETYEDGITSIANTQLDKDYVVDVIEAADLTAITNLDASPTGDGEVAGRIYIAADDNSLYRWNGSAYVAVSSGSSGVITINGESGVAGNVTLSTNDIITDTTHNKFLIKYDTLSLTSTTTGEIVKSAIDDNSDNNLVIPEDSSCFFSIKVVAKNTADAEAAAWEFKGVANRELAAAPTFVGTVTKTVYAKLDNAWDCTVAISSNSVAINVTASDSIETTEWTASVDATIV